MRPAAVPVTVAPPRPATLARDALAGVTVAVVLIPQALAYAGVAGMPPISGLYAAALPPLAAALFASSPYLQTGPVAQTSLLTFGALASRAPAGSDEYVDLGILLALIVGAVRLLLGVTRTGVVAHLMSEPMLMGFVPAGAILIVASQLPSALGAGGGAGVLAGAAHAAGAPGAWDRDAVIIAVATVAVVFGGRRLHRLFPGALVALVGGLALGALTGFGGTPVGDIPSGLPALSLDLPWEELGGLLVPGAIIALVGFAEPASIARTYATRERQAWSADREFVSQGVANLAAGLSGGYPVGGSLSRTSLNYVAGGVTRASGAITGLCVLAFLPLAAVLSDLPRAVLAAIVISSVLGLLRFGRIGTLWHVSRPQFAVAAATFVLTLALAPHIERAVAIGVGLSIAVHLARELALRIDETVTGAVLRIRPSGVVWFGNAQRLEEHVTGVLERNPGVARLELVLGGLGRIDVSGAMAIHNLMADAELAGLEVEIRDVPPQARAMLDRYAAHRRRLR
jgi:sulfate permease, SulP family